MVSGGCAGRCSGRYACPVTDEQTPLNPVVRLAVAQTAMGRLAERGTAADVREAVRWFERAASQGDAEGEAPDEHSTRQLASAAPPCRLSTGEYQYGTYLERGIGVEQDETAAAQWYRRAATQGLADGALRCTYAPPSAQDRPPIRDPIVRQQHK